MKLDNLSYITMYVNSKEILLIFLLLNSNIQQPISSCILVIDIGTGG